mgnify:CR=1 FL=1
MFEAVAGDAVLAFVGARAGGFLCVLALCLGLFFDCHGSFPLWTGYAPVGKKSRALGPGFGASDDSQPFSLVMQRSAAMAVLQKVTVTE